MTTATDLRWKSAAKQTQMEVRVCLERALAIVSDEAQDDQVREIFDLLAADLYEAHRRTRAALVALGLEEVDGG